ncbi:MAG: hypothetical protein M3O82_04865 [Verrucomicrobiota bacterium]|nr:hypothetical protein [Verrucomicrobiota bacterium]
MAQAEKIIELRQILSERFPEIPRTTRATLSTGIAEFDAALNGGLWKGAIAELTAPACSSGSASALRKILIAAAAENRWTALIDGADSFVPPADLPRVLWVRCHNGGEAMRAADLLLRDGNLPLVLLDLRLNSVTELRKIPSTSWYRFQRIVEQSGCAFLVVTRHSLVSSAAVKLVLQSRFSLDALEESEPRLEVHVARGLQQIVAN